MKNQKSFLTLAVIMMNLWVDTGYASLRTEVEKKQSNKKFKLKKLSSPLDDQEGIIAPQNSLDDDEDESGMPLNRESIGVFNDQDEEKYESFFSDFSDSYAPSKEVLTWLKNNVEAAAKQLEKKKVTLDNYDDVVRALSREDQDFILAVSEQDKDFIIGGIEAQMDWNEQENKRITDEGWNRDLQEFMDSKRSTDFAKISSILDVLPTAVQAYQAQEAAEVAHVVALIKEHEDVAYVLNRQDIDGYEEAVLAFLHEKDEELYNGLYSMNRSAREAFIEKVVDQLKSSPEGRTHLMSKVQTVQRIVDIVKIAQDNSTELRVKNFIKKALEQAQNFPEDISDKGGIADEFVKQFPDVAKAMHQYVINKSNKVIFSDLQEQNEQLQDLLTVDEQNDQPVIAVTDENRESLADIVRAIVLNVEDASRSQTVAPSRSDREDFEQGRNNVQAVKHIVDFVANLPRSENIEEEFDEAAAKTGKVFTRTELEAEQKTLEMIPLKNIDDVFNKIFAGLKFTDDDKSFVKNNLPYNLQFMSNMDKVLTSNDTYENFNNLRNIVTTGNESRNLKMFNQSEQKNCIQDLVFIDNVMKTARNLQLNRIIDVTTWAAKNASVFN